MWSSQTTYVQINPSQKILNLLLKLLCIVAFKFFSTEIWVQLVWLIVRSQIFPMTTHHGDRSADPA